MESGGAGALNPPYLVVGKSIIYTLRPGIMLHFQRCGHNAVRVKVDSITDEYDRVCDTEESCYSVQLVAKSER